MPIQLSYRKTQTMPLNSEQIDKNMSDVQEAINKMETQIDSMEKALEALKARTEVLNAGDAASANSASNTSMNTISNCMLEVYEAQSLPQDLKAHTLALLVNGSTKSLIRYDADSKAWMHLDNTTVASA